MTLPALITGASRGLGHALARELSKTRPVVCVARTVGALEDLDDAIRAAGGAATLAPMDIRTPEAMAQLCRSIHDRWGGLSLWAHTAVHAGPLTPVDHITETDLAAATEINITATARLISYVAPLLATEGRALFFDDPRAGEKFFGTYGATKAAQIALARSWRAETVNTGPRVHILPPQPMPTATRARFFPGEDRDGLATCAAEAHRLLASLA